MRARETLQSARELLEMSGLNDADREAEFIVSHCLGIDRLHLYKEDPDIPEKILLQIYEYLRRRAAREPLQYILGYAEFHGLKIKAGPGVLIPRPETELMVEEALRILRNIGKGKGTEKKSDNTKILDLCTGSGCIALALAGEFPDAEVYGTDTSKVAIRYAEENVDRNRIKNVTFLKGNLFDPLKNLDNKFDVIISNPPYIRRADMINLQPEIKDWEPVEALNGGEDGLDYYRIIIPESKNYLKEHGYLVLEIGIGQSDEVKWMAEEAGFQDIIAIRDYSGIERILIANKG
ncbi:MAG: peptide chain release factor N(5)-glutamine methyltransferase [Nitrospira sp.]|nr:peptide chain release factor N(5)-glutamine methyltransferase [Nitrospira sp.]